jgi:hypothetical protein
VCGSSSRAKFNPQCQGKKIVSEIWVKKRKILIYTKFSYWKDDGGEEIQEKLFHVITA